jgi:hypothetical protein
MNKGETYQDAETAYVRYDSTTHNYLRDPIHDFPEFPSE